MKQERLFNIKKSAVLSPCRKYRYSLWRVWDKSMPYCLFVGLNPSTADETEDDPTIRRCISFAKDWGFGGLCMANLFAFRATNPKDMKKVFNPHGPENSKYLSELCQGAGCVVAAWGTNGDYLNKGLLVKAMIGGMKCLGKTKDGHPKHPLYLKKDTELIPL